MCQARSFVQSFVNFFGTSGAPFDQYEAAVPLERVGTCFGKIFEETFSERPLWKGLRTPVHLRFVRGDNSMLSGATGIGAAMFINIGANHKR